MSEEGIKNTSDNVDKQKWWIQMENTDGTFPGVKIREMSDGVFELDNVRYDRVSDAHYGDIVKDLSADELIQELLKLHYHPDQLKEILKGSPLHEAVAKL